MSNRLHSTIEFTMPEEWLNIQHPVGKAIQDVYTELAKAYQSHEPTGEWAEWSETHDVIEDEEETTDGTD